MTGLSRLIFACPYICWALARSNGYGAVLPTMNDLFSPHCRRVGFSFLLLRAKQQMPFDSNNVLHLVVYQ